MIPHAPTARDRILLAAHDLFYRDGVRATGIDRVIAESGVAKLTFYRHFPSKNDLIRAYLDYRHQRWMAWFTEAIARHGQTPAALGLALAEWLRDPGFRGCAFLNSVSELTGALPEVADITRAHKADMTATIAAVLPASRQRTRQAQAIAVAFDGAILRAQFDDVDAAIEAFERITRAVLKA